MKTLRSKKIKENTISLCFEITVPKNGITEPRDSRYIIPQYGQVLHALNFDIDNDNCVAGFETYGEFCTARKTLQEYLIPFETNL
jgi:hypothetical protein